MLSVPLYHRATIKKVFLLYKHFWLALLPKLTDILRPVHARSTILGIYYPFPPLSDGTLMGMLYDFRAKKLYLNFMCFELHRNLEV